MEITVRGLWTLIHGMGFGALYLLACSGALVELHRFTTSSPPSEATPGQERFLKVYLLAMVVLAWAAVLTGAYVIYPWYRAAPPPGTTGLSMFPQRLLMSSPTTIDWHSLGWNGKSMSPGWPPFRSRWLHLSLSGMVATSRTTGNFALRCSALPWPRLLRRGSRASSAR